MVVADFNGDGNLDVAMAGYRNVVSILLGDGLGALRGPFIYTVGGAYSNADPEGSLVVGDFYANGKPDLAVTNEESALSRNVNG